MNKIVEYTPRIGRAERIELSNLELLRLYELPQLVLLGAARVEVLPSSSVECIRAYSRTNGLCIEVGGGRCVSSYTPLAPGLPPAWMPRIEYRLEAGSRRLFAAASLREAEPRLRDVYAPLILYPEPLAVRRVRVEYGELQLWAGCIETPGGGVAFLASGGEPLLVDIEPGVVRVEGEARSYRVSRCRPGFISTLIRAAFNTLKARVRLQGDVVVLNAVEDGDAMLFTVWNPHLHPVKLELYSDAPVREARVCSACGCEELEVIQGSMVAAVLPGWCTAGLEIQLKRASPLLRGKR